MPSITLTTPTNFKFSATPPSELAATEYTLVGVAIDVSGSMNGWEKHLEDCMKSIQNSLNHSPRAENLMVRVTTFNDSVNEIHGFVPLQAIKASDYEGKIRAGGNTSLYDATGEMIDSIHSYTEMLVQHDYAANAVIYVLTDGGDTSSSTHRPTSIKKSLFDIRAAEQLQSISTILIGINNSPRLDEFRIKSDMSQYIDMTELFNKTSPAAALAKLAGYISKSVISTSTSLNSGNTNALQNLISI